MTAPRRKRRSRPTLEGARALPGYPLWDIPHPKEPAWSVLARTVERNMPGTVAARFHDLGSYGGHGVAKANVRETARICGLDPDALEHASAKVGPRFATLLGHRLRRDDFSVERRRWCPRCLEEHGRHLAWWDVTVVSSCPRHGLELVDRCRCGGEILWKRQSVFSRCNCGAELASVPARALLGHEGAADRYVVGRLTGRDRIDLPVLDRLTLLDALEVMRNVGHLALGATDGRRAVERREGFMRLLDAGYRGMEDFPHSFRKVLDRAFAAADVPIGTAGSQRVYGVLFMWWLLNEASGRLAGRISDEVRKHAAEHLTVNKRNLLRGTLVRKRVTLIEAADICGVGFTRMRRILLARGTMPRTGKARFQTFDRKDIESLARSMEGAITSRAVADQLGVDTHFVGRFVEAGLISPVLPKALSGPWAFPPEDPGNLLRALAGKVRPVAGAAGLPIPLAAKSLGIEIPDLVVELLDGTLAAIGFDPSEVGIRAIRVDVAGMRRERRLAVSETLTARDIARRFDVKEEDAIDLLRLGAIASGRVGHCWMAEKDSAEAFFREHALLSPYAKRLGTSRKYLARSLERAGIQPAFEPPTLRRKLFKRADIDAYLDRVGWPPPEFGVRQPSR